MALAVVILNSNKLSVNQPSFHHKSREYFNIRVSYEFLQVKRPDLSSLQLTLFITEEKKNLKRATIHRFNQLLINGILVVNALTWEHRDVLIIYRITAALNLN